MISTQVLCYNLKSFLFAIPNQISGINFYLEAQVISWPTLTKTLELFPSISRGGSAPTYLIKGRQAIHVWVSFKSFLSPRYPHSGFYIHLCPFVRPSVRPSQTSILIHFKRNCKYKVSHSKVQKSVTSLQFLKNSIVI